VATGKIVLGSDGELAIQVGKWAKDKLHHIKNFCYVFNTGMKNIWKTRTYIDLFSGPGRCYIEATKEEIEGSPLIALNCKTPFTHYFFNDVDSRFVNSLKKRVATNSITNVNLFSKDCNDVIDLILQKLPRRSLDFCFIDPFNWEIKFDSIRKLTQGRRMDLAITFHIGNIKRVADRPTQGLKDFFPDSNWQEEYQKAGQEGKLSGRVLLDAYERGLREIKYVEIKDYVLMTNKTKVPLYYLIFASKNKRGADFWDKIAVRSETGQLRLSINTKKESGNLSGLRVVANEHKLLDGSSVSVVQQINDGAIITRFDKTPPPVKSSDVICPHFLELKWSYGCPFDCAWCYLKGTFRFHPTKTKPVFKDRLKVELHTRRFLENGAVPEILNAGEIADALMGEGLKEPFSRFIVPLFESQDRHKVLFVTKSDNIKNLLKINPHKQVIVSYSLNAAEVAERWERLAPSVDRRIEAARKLSEAGYEVRVRIDPLVPVPEWETFYKHLIHRVFSNFRPERITLGSLRGLQTTVNGSTDKTWLVFLKENSNWGKKVEFKVRHDMYTVLIHQLKSEYGYEQVALCKETLAMWESLGMDYKKIRCNCVW